MNRLHGLWSLGTLVGGASAAWIAGAGVSLRSHLIAAGAVMLLVLMFVSRGLLRTDETHATNGFDDNDESGRRRFTPTLLLFLLAGFFAVSLEYTSSDWAAFRLVDDFGAAAGFAGLGYIAATGGMTVGRLAGDWVGVRIGVARLLHVAIALSGIGLAVAALTPNRYAALVGYVIAGLGISTMLPRLYDDAAKLQGRPGAGLGALTAGIRIATLALPIGVGALAATSLSVGSAIAIATLPCVAGFLAVTFALRRT